MVAQSLADNGGMSPHPSNATADDSPPPSTWPRTTRRLITALLVFHLIAVVIPPLQLATTSSPIMSSPFVDRISWVFRPYDDALFLNHGYAFFAPNPGSNFLLRARLEFTDGRPAQWVSLPDVERQAPRLMYHRHFMLSEHFHGADPGAIPADASPAARGRWRAMREVFLRREQAIIEHLKQKYGASEVTIERWEHRPPTTYEYFQEGVPLDSPRLYRSVDDRRLPEYRPGGDGDNEGTAR